MIRTVTWLSVIFPILFVGLRVYTRLFVRKVFGLDDWVIVLSLVRQLLPSTSHILTSIIATDPPHNLWRHHRSRCSERSRSTYRMGSYLRPSRCCPGRTSGPSLTALRRHVLRPGQDIILHQSHASSRTTIHPSVPLVHRRHYAYPSYPNLHHCLCTLRRSSNNMEPGYREQVLAS
jgi:hypothetical protein